MSPRLVITLFFFCSLAFSGELDAQPLECRSPDGVLSISIHVDEEISFELFKGDTPLLSPCMISLRLEGGRVLGRDPGQPEKETREVRRELRPLVQEKSRVIEDHFNEISLTFKEGFGVTFRAFDDGMGYRFFTRFDGKIKIFDEKAHIVFPDDQTVYFPEEKSFHTHSERYYKHLSLSKISAEMMCSMPALVEYENGMKMAITETGLLDYAGMYLQGTSDNALNAVFPRFALKEKQTNDRNVEVEEAAEYMAVTEGNRDFPWRIFIVSENDGDLIESQMVYKLSPPLALEDTSWIRPGKVAWDWYNANNVYNVDFRAGVNTDTYKYYIDFAARFEIEYIILDEGWYVLGDLLKVSEGMDMETLFAYAKEKGVGIILWVSWKTLDDQLHEALDQFAAWGAQGIKVDFMQRDDQGMVNYYLKVAREAAKRKMLVDFHGCYKPAGLRRVYPNVITREGVRGLEQNKWSQALTPKHNVTLPFTRMVAGPMDYTPGSMTNAQKHNHAAIFYRPMSLGTRCHQLAMYVIYESPLQMLADSPTLYLQNIECMEFLSPVPSVWDRSVVLDAKVADRVVMARKRGDVWYVGGMTGEHALTYSLDLSFLEEGEYTLTLFKDGINADRCAEDYKKVIQQVKPSDRIEISMAPGGGFAGMLKKSQP